MIASIANLVYELPHKLPNDLRLRILRNKETLRKSQIWMETSSFQKSNFGNGNQKTRKSRYKTFLVLFSFTGFLYFVPNILPRIVGFTWFCNLLEISRPNVLWKLHCTKMLSISSVNVTKSFVQCLWIFWNFITVLFWNLYNKTLVKHR